VATAEDGAGAAARDVASADTAAEAPAAATREAATPGFGDAPEPLPAVAPPGLSEAAEGPRGTAATPHAAPEARPEIGARAAQQAAAALSASPDGRIELRLDPEELGPVRLGLAPGDGTITVQIAAERGETLDLLRRHADVLARELRQAGYGEVSFQFGADTASGGGSAPRHGYTSPGATDAVEAAPGDPMTAQAAQIPPARRGIVPGTLDLRL